MQIHLSCRTRLASAAVVLASILPTAALPETRADWADKLRGALEPAGKLELGGLYATDGGASLRLAFAHDDFLSSGNGMSARFEASDTSQSGVLDLDLGTSAIPSARQSVSLRHLRFGASDLRDIDVDQSILLTSFAFAPGDGRSLVVTAEAGRIDATAHPGTAARLADDAGQRTRVALAASWTQDGSPRPWFDWRVGIAPKFVRVKGHATAAQLEAAADFRVTAARTGSRLDLAFRAGLAEAAGDGRTHFSTRYFMGQERVRGFEPGGLGPRQDGDAVGGERYALLRLDLSQPLARSGPLQAVEVGLFADIGSLWHVDGHAAGLDDALFWRRSEGVFVQINAGGAELRVTVPRVSRSRHGDRTRDLEITLNARF